MKVAPPPKLNVIFKDHLDFAWQLLQSEISLQSNPNITGKDIADLLSLYMRAVEKLNSSHDHRESYFRNKVSSLMIKPNVIKVMSNSTKKNPQSPSQPSPQKKQPPTVVPNKQSEVLYNNLQSKKMEMEMYLTYQNEATLSKDKVSSMMVQHNTQADNLDRQIKNVIESNAKNLDERIKQRKLRAQTARSRSQKTYNQPMQKPQLDSIEVIKEEPEVNQRKPANNKRSNSVQIIRKRCESPQEEEECRKPRRRSTIVDIHCRIKLE